MNETFDNYILTGFSNIEGWCNINLLHLAYELHVLQKNAAVSGGAGEIGVHHGKFFIPLALLKSSFKNIAIDVFSIPYGNVDKSGKGDYDIFLENIKSYLPCNCEPIIWEGDSLHITCNEVATFTEEYGKLSMFSIDGSHTCEHTFNDLILAEHFLGAGGIIFVDDFYNPDWPGVHEGVAKYFYFHSYKFVPLCFGFQKLILCDLSYHKFYFKQIYDAVKTKYKIKYVKQYGYDSLSIRL